MGNQQTIQKCNFEDVQYVIKHKNGILLNTMSINEQNVLIDGTLPIHIEEETVNKKMRSNPEEIIIIYGKNTNDETVHTKYQQLQSLGFKNIYMYSGGLFEWLCLQDIFGEDNFQTNKKEIDIIKYRPQRLVMKRLTNE